MQDVTLTNNTPVTLTDRATGGPTYFQIDGTFGGSTVTVRASFDGGTTKTPILTLTTADVKAVDLPQGTSIEVQAVGGSGINVKVMCR